jgi:hypothetical protein
VVGGNDERPLIAQRVDLAQIEAAGAKDGQDAQINAKAPGNHEPPERPAEAPGQQHIEQQRAGQPDQAKQRQRAEADQHGQVFVGNPQRMAGAAAISHRP